MQTEEKKSRLENLFIDGTIDEETVADIEKMLTRKKVEKLHKYTIFYNEKKRCLVHCQSPELRQTDSTKNPR